MGVVVAAAFLWLLVRGIDMAALRGAFARLSWPAVLLALTFTAAAHAVRVVRWWGLLRVLEPRLAVTACARPFLCGFAFNNVLPLRTGDAVRAVAFQEELRSPAMRVVGTLVIERMADLIAVSAMFAGAMLAVPVGALPRAIVVAIAALAALGFVVLLAAVVALPWVEAFLGRLPRRFGDRRWVQWAARQGLHLAGALKLVRSARGMGVMGILSVIVWACEGAAFVTVATALGAAAPWPGPWLSLALGSVSAALPLTPGHVGTFDYFAALGLVAYGAPVATAAAFALTVHALWVPFTIAGLLLYWMPRRRAARR